MAKGRRKNEVREKDVFSYYLRDVRTRRGLTLTDLSHRTGLSQSYLSRLEMSDRKEPSLSVLLKLAKALNTDAFYFVRALGFDYQQVSSMDLIELIKTGNSLSLNNKDLTDRQLTHIISIIETLAHFNDTANEDKAGEAI